MNKQRKIKGSSMAKIKKKQKPLKTKKRSRKIPLNISIDNLVLLESRHVFLYEVINAAVARRICTELVALDKLSSESIVLVINSPGGSVTDGFAIIDTMRSIKAPVFTLVTGMAASMAGIISVTGYRRIISSNSYWMGHEMKCGGYDYFDKYMARTKFFEELWKRLIEHLKKFTKLTLDDLEKLRRGELWLSAEEAKKRGIADHIV